MALEYFMSMYDNYVTSYEMDVRKNKKGRERFLGNFGKKIIFIKSIDGRKKACA